MYRPPFPIWSNGRGLAVDIAVINPLLHLGSVSPCEDYATSQKHRKYDFVGSRYSFAPVVFETTGGVNTEGEQILKQIFRFASARSGSRHSFFVGRAWARLSCCVQDSVAQAVLNRAPDLLGDRELTVPPEEEPCGVSA